MYCSKNAESKKSLRVQQRRNNDHNYLQKTKTRSTNNIPHCLHLWLEPTRQCGRPSEYLIESLYIVATHCYGEVFDLRREYRRQSL